MNPQWQAPLALLICALVEIFTWGQQAQARAWRPGQLPNGNRFNCLNCHMSPDGGGARNAFGQQVERLVRPGSFDLFWGPELAKLDADGDGFTNGEELHDPLGTWQFNDPNPGNPLTVSSPGDPRSTQPTTFAALLTGTQEPSAVSTAARGVALFTLRGDLTSLDYRLFVQGGKNLTGAHIHLGRVGQDGGVIHALSGGFQNFVSGTLTINQSDIDRLRAGQYYVNVHSASHSLGEIRGQIVRMPLTFRADLRGSFQRPGPVVASGIATMFLTLNDALDQATWSTRTVGVDNIVASHIHQATAGASGPVVVSLTGVFVESATGSFEVSSFLLEDLVRERLYVNIHTVTHSDGEVRGQLRFVGGQGPGLFVGELTGEQQNPPVASAARGVVLIRVDPSRTYLEYWLSAKGISDALAAHIHRGAPGANGSVVVPLSSEPFDQFLSGVVPLTPSLLEDLTAGHLYVNVHTVAHPDGELRGQLRATPVLPLQATLNGLQEAQGVDSPGRGLAEVVLDPTLRIGDVRLAVSNLTNILASHIHEGAFGADGSVVHPLTGSFESVASVGLDLSPLDLEKLLGERYYVNVHTTAHPSGEIRGQLGFPTGSFMEPVAGDINQDGRVGAEDLFILQGTWAAGPLD